MPLSFLIKKFNNQYFWLLIIIAIAAVLRLINLGVEPYWGDEVLSLDIVRHYQNDFSGMLSYVATIEIHPPLYYILLYGWTCFLGFGEFGVRLLSLLFGLGVIILVYLLARKLFNNQNLALLAAFLTAVLPMPIEFSQEAQPYIIFTFFGLLATWCFWSYRIKPKKIFLAVYILATLAGFYLHYSYLFFGAALAFFWLGEALLKKEKTERGRAVVIWLTVHALVFLGYFKQLIIFLYKLLLGEHFFLETIRTANPFRRLDFFEQLITRTIWFNKNILVNKVEFLAVILFKVLFLTALIWLLMKYAEKIKEFLQKDVWPLLFMVVLAILPILFFVFSPQGIAYAPTFERHIITSSVFLIILLAYFFSRLKLKFHLLFLIVFLLSVMNWTILIIADDSLWDPYHRLKVMAEHINQSYRPGDIVLIAASSFRTDFNYFLREDISCFALYPLGLLDWRDDYLATRETLGLMENESQLRQDFQETNNLPKVSFKMKYLVEQYNPRRIWLVNLDDDSTVQEWFYRNRWTEVMVSLGDLFPVQLYVQR